MLRSARYLRVSLLSACNLRCTYCMPDGVRKPPLVADFDDVCRAIRFLHGAGVRKIRFTGGEPTLYYRLRELVSLVKGLDAAIHTAITSNALLLAQRATGLGAAGLDSVNISLDTLDAGKFATIAGRGSLSQVLRGVERAIERIPSVKLNAVMMRGINDDEVEVLIRYADELGIDIRFIEFMPNASSAPGDPRFISGAEVRSRLPWNLREIDPPLRSAARYYVDPALRIRVGFIDPVSHPFCDGCDRLRLTAEGRLYACLFETGSIDLFGLLRERPGDADRAIEQLVAAKRFMGCAGAVAGGEPLPSFTNLGG